MDLVATVSQSDLLEAALTEVLACPDCQARLVLEAAGKSLRCGSCGSTTPLVEGIPVFASSGPGPEGLQAEEMAFRNQAASEQLRNDTADLLSVAGKHHSVPLMGRYAHHFRSHFSAGDWLLDIGTGYSWHWKNAEPGPRVIGIDLSLGNLLLAQRLLADQPRCVLLICADASRLPLANGSLAGAWSVQAFQLFPEPIFQQVQRELDRVLRKDFMMELHHLHPALLYRFLCRLRGRTLHRRGRHGPFETNRLLLAEWLQRWASFREGRLEASSGYSELFFHPELGVRPRPYPSGLERFLVQHAPGFSSLFARQGYLRLKNRSCRNRSNALEAISR